MLSDLNGPFQKQIVLKCIAPRIQSIHINYHSVTRFWSGFLQFCLVWLKCSSGSLFFLKF